MAIRLAGRLRTRAKPRCLPPIDSVLQIRKPHPGAPQPLARFLRLPLSTSAVSTTSRHSLRVAIVQHALLALPLLADSRPKKILRQTRCFATYLPTWGAVPRRSLAPDDLSDVGRQSCFEAAPPGCNREASGFCLPRQSKSLLQVFMVESCVSSERPIVRRRQPKGNKLHHAAQRRVGEPGHCAHADYCSASSSSPLPIAMSDLLPFYYATIAHCVLFLDSTRRMRNLRTSCQVTNAAYAQPYRSYK
jgi:hypothetical protein